VSTDARMCLLRGLRLPFAAMLVRFEVVAPRAPQWEVPRVGTPAPEVQSDGVHKEEPSGAPTQAARQLVSSSKKGCVFLSKIRKYSEI
jgi:hypothetical protein